MGDFTFYLPSLAKDTSISGQYLKVNNKLNFLKKTANQVNRTEFRYPMGENYTVMESYEDNTYDLIKFGGDSWDYSNGILTLNTDKATNELGYLSRVASIIPARGYKINKGDTVQVCFYDRTRQKPYIRQLVKRGNLNIHGETPVNPVVEGINEWFQAHRYFTQNPTGPALVSGVYRIGPNSSTQEFYTLPTYIDWTESNQIIRENLYPFGIARCQPEDGQDLYMTAYPIEGDDSNTGYGMAAYDFNGRYVRAYSEFFFSGGSVSSQNSDRSSQFFYDKGSKWATIILKTDTPTQNRLLSFKYNNSNDFEKATATVNKQTYNGTVYGFEKTDPENANLKINKYYALLPYCAKGLGGSNEKLQFWEFNSQDKAWSTVNEINHADIPTGGPSIVPDVLDIGTEQTGPLAAIDEQFFVPIVGGTQDLLNPDNWNNLYWAFKGYKGDGSVGTRGISRTLVSSNAPRIVGFESEILAAPFPLVYQFSGDSILDNPSIYKVYGDISLLASSSFYNKFYKCWPIFMPCAGANYQRFPTQNGFINRLAYAAEKQWPSDTNTRPGGAVVDQDKVIWFVVMEPEAIRYAASQTGALRPNGGSNDYTQEDSGASATVYFWTVFRDGTECFQGVSRGFGWNVNSTFHPVYNGNVGTDPDSWPQVNEPCPGPGLGPDPQSRTSYSMEDKGSRPVWKHVFNYSLGYLWHTKLYGLKADNSVIEIDISNKRDCEETLSFGGSRTGITSASGIQSYTKTFTNIPEPDAVWQWIPFKYQDLHYIAILRDEHSDNNGDCYPYPVLQIWNTDSSSKLSTVRLGSYEEMRDYDYNSEESDFSFKDGDYIWNPYAYGAPKMKACQSDDDDSVKPFIFTIVLEEKKIVDEAIDVQVRRIYYYSIKVANPADPEIDSRDIYTSSDIPGEVPVGRPPGEPLYDQGDTGYKVRQPNIKDFDTLMFTDKRATWIHKSRIYESKS